MYEGYDLLQEIQNRTHDLVLANSRLFKNKEELAKSEFEYKTAVTKKALQLRTDDMPVTLINLTIYGYKEIAELRFKRDIAQSKVEANEEFINSTKLVLRLLEAQMNREWTSKGGM